MMERVNRILRNPMWQGAQKQIESLELTRVYCGHSLDHLLHVARLAYIESLEQSLNISKEIIYAAALLHDIGRGLEYEQGIPHEEGSCALGESILMDCDFSQEERRMIVDAIHAHRDKACADAFDLAGLLYRADKKSRNCFWCEAKDTCNWSLEKRNMEVKD